MLFQNNLQHSTFLGGRKPGQAHQDYAKMDKFLPVCEFSEILVFRDEDGSVLIGEVENHFIGYAGCIVSDGDHAMPCVSKAMNHTPADILICENFHAAFSGTG